MTLTHKMIYHLVRAEDSIRTIKETPISTQARSELLKRMGAENIHAVSKLVGSEVSFSDAQKIHGGKTLVSGRSIEMLLSNYRSTCDFIYSTGNDRHLSFSPSLLMHLNKLLMNGLVDSWDAGRFRNVTDKLRGDYDVWASGFVHDITGIDLQRHFFNVMTWFLDSKFYIHPLIKISAVFYELFKNYPFVSGNQVTSIAILELLFEKSRMSLGGMFPVGRNVVLYEEEYLEAWKNTSSSGDDLTGWTERFIRGVSLDLIALKSEVAQLGEEKIKHKKNKLLDLNARQMKLVRYLRIKPKVKRSEYVSMMGVSTMTAYRDLNELLERKIIEARGGGRSTYYMLTKDEQQSENSSLPMKKPIVKVIGRSAASSTDTSQPQLIQSFVSE